MSQIQSGWGIRFIRANDYREEGTIGSTIGNYRAWGDRQADNITVFTGIYGIDQYLIWETHANLPFYDFSTVAINLELYRNKNVDDEYFREFYRIQDVKYNPNSSKFVIYGVSEATFRLETALVHYDVKSIPYIKVEKREYNKFISITSIPYTDEVIEKEKDVPEPIDLLMNILHNNNIFIVVYHEDADDTAEDEKHFDYNSFNIDPSTKVRDFIEYIADENGYEWCVTKEIDEENIPSFYLHIGKQLWASGRMNATKPFNRETDFHSQSNWFKKVQTFGSPMDILSNWDEDWVCIWAKHTAGSRGDLTKGCFAPNGWGHIPKELYVRSLEGEKEQNLAYALMLRRVKRFPSITMGLIVEDTGLEQIEKISVQKDWDHYTTKTPKNIVFNDGIAKAVDPNTGFKSLPPVPVQHLKEMVDKITPYAGDGYGLAFPSPEFVDNDGNPVKPANSVIAQIEGRTESNIHLGQVWGNGDPDFLIPDKNVKDLRLKMPGELGGNIYWDSEKKHWLINAERISLQNQPTDASEIPDSSYSGLGNHITLYKSGMIKLANENVEVTIHEGGCFWILTTNGKYNVTFDADDGKISITSDNEIIVNAPSVILAGGGKKLSHADHVHNYQHVHTTGNMGMPVTPQTLTIHGAINTDTHLPNQGTTKTEAD